MKEECVCVPIEPHAEMEQNSTTPSNAGLSSPTRAGNVVKEGCGKEMEPTYIWFRGKLALQMFLVLLC